MRVVVYFKENFEPLTIINLHPTDIRLLRELGRIQLVLSDGELLHRRYNKYDEIERSTDFQVILDPQIFVRNGVEHIMLFTNDEGFRLRCIKRG